MRIIIPGGSGQVGTLLARQFVADGHDVVVLSRTTRSAPWKSVVWDGVTLGDWTACVAGADVVMNLAGRSVNCRYNAANRQEMLDSRVRSTRAVGLAIAAAKAPPRLWLQASTATIYAHRLDAANDEDSGIIGGDEPDAPDSWRFSIEVAKAWEQAALEVDLPHTRRVLLRSAMTMSPDRGGIFDVLAGLARRWLGGRSGDGRQYVSWIHERDFVRAVYWLVDSSRAGPVNVASPNPAPNAEFMRTLRAALGIRCGLPAARWMLEIGARMMRTESELLLKSRRVVPGHLLADGFRFEYPDWSAAAADLATRWQQSRRSDR